MEKSAAAMNTALGIFLCMSICAMAQAGVNLILPVATQPGRLYGRAICISIVFQSYSTLPRFARDARKDLPQTSSSLK